MKKKMKNTVASAPADMLEVGQLFTCDGRKREDEEFVGFRNPDTDSESRPLRRRPGRNSPWRP
jgi:hypothetical protein